MNRHVIEGDNGPRAFIKVRPWSDFTGVPKLKGHFIPWSSLIHACRCSAEFMADLTSFMWKDTVLQITEMALGESSVCTSMRTWVQDPSIRVSAGNEPLAWGPSILERQKQDHWSLLATSLALRLVKTLIKRTRWRKTEEDTWCLSDFCMCAPSHKHPHAHAYTPHNSNTHAFSHFIKRISKQMPRSLIVSLFHIIKENIPENHFISLSFKLCILYFSLETSIKDHALSQDCWYTFLLPQ